MNRGKTCPEKRVSP